MSPTVPVRLRRMERLLEISSNLASMDSLQPALDAIIETARELTLSQAASIAIPEDQTGTLKFIACPPEHREQLKLVRVPLEKSIAGQCYQQGTPVSVQELNGRHLIYRGVDQLLGFETASLLAMPLVYRNKTIGVLEVVNKFNGVPFNEDDAGIVEVLATQAALAIQNNHLHEKAKAAAEQAAELDRMKSDFVAITSHELRTPLGLILGHATLLEESITEEALKTPVKIILDNALRLKKIMDDLIRMDKARPSKYGLHRQLEDLNQVIAEVVASFQAAASAKRLHLHTDLPPGILSTLIEKEKIALALASLLQNSLTFTNPGGHILVQAEALPGFAKVSVVDTGIGIPAGELHRIFERFYQVEKHMTRRHGGLGLGLAIARAMIEAHGGQIWVESIEGKGSNFSFLLPNGTAPLIR